MCTLKVWNHLNSASKMPILKRKSKKERKRRRKEIVATFRARELQFNSENNGMAKHDHQQVQYKWNAGACLLARCKVIRTNHNISRLSWCTENKSERSIEMISQKSSISHLNCSFANCRMQKNGSKLDALLFACNFCAKIEHFEDFIC